MMQAARTGQRLWSFDAYVLEISLGSPSILWYRYTFQGKKVVVGSFLFIGLSIADNIHQGEHITL